PERPFVTVRDHRERQPGPLGEVHVVAGGRRRACARRRVVVVAPTAPHGGARQRERHEQSETAEPSSHRSATSLSGASVVRYSMLCETSMTGPSPAGGSCPVMAVSCSSTSQRS